MQQATLVETESILDLAAVAPNRWIAQGATTTVPLTVEALNMGAPQPNVSIGYTITQGTASLTSATATTSGAGLATVTAQLTNLAAMVQASACVVPGNSPCQTFTLFATPASMWKIESFSGTTQVLPTGQTFQPLKVRVTDGSAAANPVMGATVTFVTTLERNPDQGGMPIILGTSQTPVMTDQNGLASILPTVGSLSPCDAYITVTAGSASAQFELQSVVPITATPGQPVWRSLIRSPRRAESLGLQTAMPLDSGALPLGNLEATPSGEEPSSSAASSAMQDHKFLIQLPGGKP